MKKLKPRNPVMLPLISLVLLFIVQCRAEPTPISQTTPIPEGIVEVTVINENKTVTSEIIQQKTFDQCNSASPFKAQVLFSQSSSQGSQEELVLKATIGGEVSSSGDFAPGVKVKIEGAIEKHFASSITSSQGHQESVGIEVPPYTLQEYVIVWQETREEGTVEYVEDGETKTAEYSYRTGLELVNTTGTDLSCVGEPPTETPIPPTATFTPEPPTDTPVSVPTDTPIPTSTNTPKPTNTPRPTPTPPATLTPGQLIVSENFDTPATGLIFWSDCWEVITDETGNGVVQCDNTNPNDLAGGEITSNRLDDFILEYRVRLIEYSDASWGEGLMWVAIRENPESENQVQRYVIAFLPTLQSFSFYYQGTDTDNRWVKPGPQPNSMDRLTQNDTWNMVRAEVQGTKFIIWLDGQKVIEIDDDKIREGRITLGIGPSTFAQFDDIRIWEILP